MFANQGDQFAIERDDSFKSSISTIYQSFGGNDLYPTLEDKASALLYFIVKTIALLMVIRGLEQQYFYIF